MLTTQHKKLSLLTRDYSLPTFTSNKTITNLIQYELSQTESDLLKAGFYFSIQPGKIQKSEFFTKFEKIHCSFINNLKSKETENQVKVRLSYFANFYFCYCKLSPCILRQHHVSQNLRKHRDIVITKPDKENLLVILDQKLYNNTIQKIILGTSKFESSMKTQPSLKLRDNFFYVRNVYDNLYPSGSAPARI